MKRSKKAGRAHGVREALKGLTLHRYVLAVERSTTAISELVLDLELGLVVGGPEVLELPRLAAPTRRVLRGITEDLRVMVRRLRELRGRVATDLDPRRGVR